MKKLVIFDLDGTILNTISDLGTAANYALSKNGFPTHSLASYPFFVGNGVKKLIERTLPEDARKEETVDMLLADFKSYYNDHLAVFTKPYDGIVELMHNLKERGIKMAVASNKYQLAVDAIVSTYFSDIDFVSSEGQKDSVPIKPDPSIVFAILEKAGISKQETLYVGDSGVDMETARRACVDSVGVTWGFRQEKELKDSFATFIVDKPSKILDIAVAEDPLSLIDDKLR